MIGVPKPTKKSRLSSKTKVKEALADYRSVQAALAIHRDNSLCIFCYFLLGKKTPRADVHHVYGRGKEAGDRREHYTSLACTCKKHHIGPIKSDVPDSGMEWVVTVLRQANETPINPEFSHPALSLLPG